MHNEQQDKTQVEIVPVTSLAAAINAMKNADVLALGVGSSISGLDTTPFFPLIGKTPIIIGRLMLPSFAAVWDKLNIFETSNSGSQGELRAIGLSPLLPASNTVPTNTIIPNDSLGATNAPIISGEEAPHRFYAALGQNSLVLSIRGDTPSSTTLEERNWSYLILKKWLSLDITSSDPFLQVR